MVKKILLVIALVLTIWCLVGCQTVEGFGGDIKWMGEKGAEVLEEQ